MAKDRPATLHDGTGWGTQLQFARKRLDRRREQLAERGAASERIRERPPGGRGEATR